MATVILLHSALGLTRHVDDWAQVLQSEGHEVYTPDLFAGHTFNDLDTAVSFVDGEGGPPAFVDRALAAIPTLPEPLVYAGFSLGAGVAQLLATQQDNCAGLIMMSGLIPPDWLDGAPWPTDLPAQLHRMERDPWVTDDEAAALKDHAGHTIEEYVYPGDAHLFGFEGHADYDDEASHRMYEHVSDFLGSLE
ncbi:dienelactone hydrolase family protein [Demequina sediminicola]|uniref:dienelactone hydrolase family protein n=1 Tax=Demequina sediminicola TaxID=1095026 RepID=UPI0009E48C20|nr:alpha/beta fold hydrolase [Demequina sediminicola]